MDKRTEAAIDKSLAKMGTTDLSEWLGNLVAQQVIEVGNRAEAQTRQDIAGAIEDQFISTANRKMYGNNTPADAVAEALAEWPCTQDIPQLQRVKRDMDETGLVPSDFKAGILFCLALIRDEEFEL